MKTILLCLLLPLVSGCAHFEKMDPTTEVIMKRQALTELAKEIAQRTAQRDHAADELAAFLEATNCSMVGL